MPAKVILNPYANRWKARQQLPEAEQALREAGLAYELVMTEAPGHAIEIARLAVREGFDPIIAAGGDSTNNEVVNGLAQAYADRPIETRFGFLPMGTANDLADNLGMPKDLRQAAAVIAAGQSRQLDLITANQRFFLNNSSVGLESAITVIQSEMTWVHGVFRYLLASLVGIARNPQWQMHIKWAEGEYQGPVTLVSIGNNPRTGGIFYTVPDADPFDGRLSFVYGSITSRLKILRTMPMIMKAGKGNYTEDPRIHQVHSTWLSVRTEPETAYHSDGEIISRAAHEVLYQVYPAWLPILLPA